MPELSQGLPRVHGLVLHYTLPEIRRGNLKNCARGRMELANFFRRDPGRGRPGPSASDLLIVPRSDPARAETRLLGGASCALLNATPWPSPLCSLTESSSWLVRASHTFLCIKGCAREPNST